MKEKIVKFLTSEGVKLQIALGIGALIAGLVQRPYLIEKILSFIGLNENKETMSDFDYKKYLENNPLLEKMTDKEREDKLQQAIRGGGKEKPLRKLAALGKKMDDEYEKTLDPDYDKADEDEDAYERRLGLEEANIGLADIRKEGNRKGREGLMRAMMDYNLQNVPDTEAFVDGFADGANLYGNEFINNKFEKNIDGKIMELEEALNPEVQRTVNNLIKAMAKKYGYEEKDAVFAIQAALKQREFDNK